MGTVHKEIADEIIRNNGYYPGDPRVIKVVQYNNQFNGGLAYGLVYEIEPAWMHNRYETSDACHNPVVIWEAK